MRRILVAGAGLSGATCAVQFARAGYEVYVMEERDHIAGNAYDHYDENGVLIHKYGPHIFHTNSEGVFAFLSQFTEWNDYQHKVVARVQGKDYSMPLNITSVGEFFSLTLKDEVDLRRELEVRKIVRKKIESAEDFLLSSIGRELMDAFFAGYSEKQWGKSLYNLDPSIVARVPLRYSFEDRYFLDRYQGIPKDGYSAMVSRMLNHPMINLKKNHAAVVGDFNKFDLVIYTGPLDRLLSYKFGRLPYRSLEFRFEYYSGVDFIQSVGTINYPSINDGAFTRATEFKHLTGQKISGTTLVKEFPGDNGNPYYPIPNEKNKALHQDYVDLLNINFPNVYPIGRLAEYRYYNMDQAVGSALAFVKKFLRNEEK